MKKKKKKEREGGTGKEKRNKKKGERRSGGGENVLYVTFEEDHQLLQPYTLPRRVLKIAAQITTAVIRKKNAVCVTQFCRNRLLPYL